MLNSFYYLENTMSKAAIVSRGLVVSALSVALVACVNMQAPQPTAISHIPQNFAQNSSGTTIAEKSYKEFISDPKLLQVIEIGLNNNRDLRTATLNIERVQQQYQITKNSQLPTIGVMGNAVRQVSPSINPNNPVSTFQVGLGMTAYELDFWGRVQNLKDAALNNYLATQSAKEAVQIGLISNITQVWLNYAFAQANLNLAEQTLKAQVDAYNLNKKRFEVGIDSEVPLKQAQISVETARNDVATYKTQILQAKNLLDLLAGSPVPQNLLPNDSIKNITLEKNFAAGLPSDLLNHRPDLKAAEYSLRAAGANIGAAKAQMFPTISLY